MMGTIDIKTLRVTGTSLVEVMRDELRYTLSEGRKFSRASILNDKRPILPETNGKQCLWSCHRVAEKAEELKERTLPMKDYVLLQKSLMKDEETVNSFLRADNVLEALTRDLTRNDPAIQLIAASCCCNIALVSSRVCDALVKIAGPYLVAGLHTMNYPLLEVCAWTIGNLSTSSKFAFEVLYAQGCVRRLISLVDDCDDSVRTSIAYAIKHCLRTGHDIITDSEVTDLTLALLRRNDVINNREFLWILALLSSRDASHVQLLCAIEPIYQQIWNRVIRPEERDVELIMPGIRILGNTISEPTGEAADKILDSSKNNDVAIFVDTLLSHSGDCVRKETLWFLGNLYTHVQPRIRARVRTDLTSVLNSLERFVG